MALDYYFGRTEGGDVSGFNDPVAANFAYKGNPTLATIEKIAQALGVSSDELLK